MEAGVETADVTQIPGDVGVDGLPVGIAVELRHAANLLVEQLGGRSVEHGIVGDELPGGVLARFGRAVDRLVRGIAQRVELHVQIVDAGAYRRGVVEAAREFLRTAFILSRARSVFLRTFSLSSLRIAGSTAGGP